MKSHFLSTLLLCFLLKSGFSISAPSSWKSGIARVEITPRDPMWLAGYGNRDHPSEGTLHPLWAKALALEDAAGKRAVLVTMDLLGIPKNISDGLRKRVQATYKLTHEQVILNSSHTHTGPVLRGALYDIYPLETSQLTLIETYSQDLENKLFNLIGKALSSMTPVEIYSQNGTARFQVNRRNNNEQTLHLQHSLNGPNDFAVPVMKIVDKKGNMLAIVFGYACHPTVLSDYNWSGDYPGFAQIALEASHPGTMAMFFQGAGADQNPLPRRSVALARQYGETLAASVNAVLEKDMKLLAPQLTMAYTEVDLTMNAPPGKDQLMEMAAGTADYQQRWASRILSETEKGIKQPLRYPYPVQAWNLGGQTIIAMGGEVVVEYAIALKQILGPDIFVMGYSNDVMAYIPSVRILREGGYEGASSQIVYGLPGTWEATLESIIISGIIGLVEKLNINIPESTLTGP